MTEEAKCLKIKAHFGETRGPISTESVCAAPDSRGKTYPTEGEVRRAKQAYLFPHIVSAFCYSSANFQLVQMQEIQRIPPRNISV